MSPARRSPGKRTPRLGLCRIFLNEPMQFRAATATALLRRDLENRKP